MQYNYLDSTEINYNMMHWPTLNCIEIQNTEYDYTALNYITPLIHLYYYWSLILQKVTLKRYHFDQAMLVLERVDFVKPILRK